MKKIRKSLWPEETVAMICRYIPMMKVSFGDQDSDVIEVETLFENFSSCIPEESRDLGNADPKSTSVGNKKGGRRPPNKKKNKKKRK